MQLIVNNLGQEVQDVLRLVCERLIESYSSTRALIFIGSRAEGESQKNSDLDIVWVHNRSFSRYKIYELSEGFLPEVQIVPLTKKSINEHFRFSTTMAHSIQKGIVLFDPNNYMGPYLSRQLTIPSREWIKNWFHHWEVFYRGGQRERRRNIGIHRKYCGEEYYCIIPNYLARACVNFAILYLELNGIIPTTKKQIVSAFLNLGRAKVVAGLKAAFITYREDREMNWEEGEVVAKTAMWLRGRLRQRLKG
jgi:predicted nucleotidyltransferase